MSSSIKRPARAPASLSQDGMNRAIALRSYTAQPPQLSPATAPTRELAAIDDILASQNPTYQLQALTLRAEMLSTSENWEGALHTYSEIIRQVESAPLSSGERQRMLGLAHLNRTWLMLQQDQIQTAITACQQALDLLSPLVSEDPEGLAPSLMMLYRMRSQIQRRQGLLPQALADLEQSARLQQQLQHSHRVDPVDLIHDGLHLADLRQTLQEPQQALQALQSILPYLEQVSDPLLGQDLSSSFYTRRAQVFESLQQPLLAYADYRNALKFNDAESTPGNWLHLFLLAAALGLREQGQAPPNRELTQARALLSELEATGEMDAQLGLPLLVLADLLHAEQAESALDLYATAIRCLERSGASKHNVSSETLAQAYLGRAQLLQNLDQAPKALTSYRQARRLLQAQGSQQILAEIDLKLALCCQQAGKPQQALEAFDLAAAEAGAAPDQPDPSSIWVQIPYFRAFLHVLDLQAPTQALQDLLRVNTLCPDFASYDLACLYARMGQIEAALKALQAHLASAYALSPAEILADSDLACLHSHPDWPLPA
ncbi:MAG: TPR end-of-group domain-containing protein [Candidatus Sericytochromatia bacterium]